MSYLKKTLVVMALIVSNAAYSAVELTPEQSEVKKFIEKMYSYDPMTFEEGYFLKKTSEPLLRNEVPALYSAIKYIPRNKCALLKLFFNEEVLKKNKEDSDCIAPDRYPFLSDENRSSVTRYENIPLAYIKAPFVFGDRAKVEVFPAGNKKISNSPRLDLGRNLYFLINTKNGWRITNVMIHLRWPDLDDRGHNCYFSFAKPPNEEEKKEIPSHCR